MSQPRRRRNRGKNQKSKGAKAQKPTDIWRPVPPLGPVSPIAMVDDPTVVIRSLGEPPLPGHATIAEHYLAAVVERAAGMATALAASADLLDVAEPE